LQFRAFLKDRKMNALFDHIKRTDTLTDIVAKIENDKEITNDDEKMLRNYYISFLMLQYFGKNDILTQIN
jgi:hypothetical protein